MRSIRMLQLLVALACVVSVSGVAWGQKRVADVQGFFRPPSQQSGWVAQELRNMYDQDVGSGYSVQSLNSLALQHARAQSGYYGQLSTASQSPSQQRQSYVRPSGSSLGKPFSSFSSSPTTSPYLNLFREDFGGNSDLNYQTLVRPQLQQQSFNQQVQRQGIEMARRMQSMAAQSDFNPQGDKNQFPTGHQTVMRYYSHFYPTAPYRPGKQAP